LVRVASATLVVLAALLLGAPRASAHAILLSSAPPDGARIAAAPARAVLRFSEGVQLLRPTDAAVVDRAGRILSGGARARAGVVVVPLPRALPPASYTLRYRVVSADAHIVDGATTFATGGSALRPAISIDNGPPDTSAWAVLARFLEIAGLGGALALIVFRVLVTRGRDPGYQPRLWCALAIAVLGELAVLVTKAATSLAESPLAAVGDPNGVYRVFSETRFGAHAQARVGLLLIVIAVVLYGYLGEQERLATSAIAAALLIACLVLISSQGHAGQAPGGALSVIADAIHLTAISIWVGGLAALALALRGAEPGAGATLIARFSTVAVVAVGVAVVTGTLRAIGELDAPAQLWQTAYGRTILVKVALLGAVAVLALANRRVLGRASTSALAMVRRNLRAELALALAIVLAAALLVAEVPGRL
jgi:copper transport protein